jgi:hypothetical protein
MVVLVTLDIFDALVRAREANPTVAFGRLGCERRVQTGHMIIVLAHAAERVLA